MIEGGEVPLVQRANIMEILVFCFFVFSSDVFMFRYFFFYLAIQ
jgi:hypothetical protein